MISSIKGSASIWSMRSNGDFFICDSGKWEILLKPGSRERLTCTL